MPEKIQVLFASSEVSPLAQTGGLAEVAGSLPQAIASHGLDATVIMPAYRQTLKQFQFKELYPGLSVTMDGKERPCSVLGGRGRGNQRVLLIRRDKYFDREGLYGDGAAAYPDNP
ncbi:MAG: glycogen/starch synthase, partial [Deltaproteobacteria bacterium]|nr:glycogen/starch synthase [Deltaproteobacteria bacterium]